MSNTGRFHFSYNCQCPLHDDEPIVINLEELLNPKTKNKVRINPVIREWREEYLRGFGQAAYDQNRSQVDSAFTYGFAFNAFTQGYRAALRSAHGQ